MKRRESAKFLEQNAKVMVFQVQRRLIAVYLFKDKLYVLETDYSLEYNRSKLEMLRFSSFQSQAAEPTISLSKTLEEDGSEMVATVANLSHFVFGIVQLCLMSNRVTWRRHKTDNFEPVSACMQWIGLSSNSWDTDLWRRHFGTVMKLMVLLRLR
ncbi:hypothetical protein Bca101_081443 [Brassica carinata]